MLSTQECLLAVSVHVPPVRSFKSLMVAGKKDACLYTVRHGICVSCLECPLLCLGGAGINLKLMTTPLPWRTVWPVWQLSCDVGERAAAVHSILNSCVLDSCNHCCCCCTTAMLLLHQETSVHMHHRACPMPLTYIKTKNTNAH